GCRRIGGRWLTMCAGCGGTHPIGKSAPFGIVLRGPEFSATMRPVSSGLFRERVQQQPALERLRRSHELRDDCKVAARLLISPGISTSERTLERESSGQGGRAVVAARAAVALLEENGFDLQPVALVVQSGWRLGSRKPQVYGAAAKTKDSR